MRDTTGGGRGHRDLLCHSDQPGRAPCRLPPAAVGMDGWMAGCAATTMGGIYITIMGAAGGRAVGLHATRISQLRRCAAQHPGWAGSALACRGISGCSFCTLTVAAGGGGPKTPHLRKEGRRACLISLGSWCANPLAIVRLCACWHCHGGSPSGPPLCQCWSHLVAGGLGTRQHDYAAPVPSLISPLMDGADNMGHVLISSIQHCESVYLPV